MTETARQPSRLLLPVLFAPVFMVILDVFIVNVTAPSLQSELGASASQVQWVVAAYLLTYAISLITGGRMGDVFGRRRMFLAGVAGFTVASALCAAAPSPGALIGARLVQGFAAAAMWPQVLSIVQVELSAAERPRAFGLQGLVGGLASVTGQIVGGGLIALDVLDLGWRSVFLINVPIGVAVLVVALGVVPESRSATAGRLDLRGMALATLALVLLLVPAVEGRDLGWPAWTFVALAAAPVAAAAFVAFERRVGAAGGWPLVELRLFAQRTFRVGALAGVTLMTMTSFFLLLSLYLQEGAGLSAIQGGLAFVPLAVAFAGGSVAGARMPARARARMPVAGAGLVVIGLLGTIAAVAGGEAHISLALVLATVPVGAGMGLAVPTMVALVLGSVPVQDAGSGSGILATAQQLGNALGVAVVATVFFGVLGPRPDGRAFADAFAIGAGALVVLALVAAALFTRARDHAGAQRGAESGPNPRSSRRATPSSVRSP